MLKCTLCQEMFEHEDGEGAPCPRCKGTDTIPLPEPPPSAITVRFFAPGSVAFNLEAEGQVTAGQFLLDEGRFAWAMERQRRAIAERESQIAVPPAGVGQILRGMRSD